MSFITHVHQKQCKLTGSHGHFECYLSIRNYKWVWQTCYYYVFIPSEIEQNIYSKSRRTNV